MSIIFARPFPVLPGLIVDLSHRKSDSPANAHSSVSVRDSGTYLNLYEPATGITFSQRISKARDLDLKIVPQLDADLVNGTSRTLIMIGLLMCIPVFTAVIGIPIILLGFKWPTIVSAAGALQSS